MSTGDSRNPFVAKAGNQWLSNEVLPSTLPESLSEGTAVVQSGAASR